MCKFLELDKPRIILEVLKGKSKDNPLRSERTRKALRAKTQAMRERPSQEEDQLMEKMAAGEDKFMMEVNEKKTSMKRGDNSKSLFPLSIVIFGFAVMMALLTTGIYTTANLRSNWLSFMIK
jgi:hypothetical protein